MSFKFLRYLSLFTLLVILSAQEGCVTTDALKKKQAVKSEMIAELKNEIMDLGGKPLTKDEAKYKGKLGNDKYIKALKEQIEELKAEKASEEADAKKKAEELKLKKEKEEEEAKKKAEKAKKEKDRAAAIESVKKEILFLGQTPIPEYEFSNEDEYITALRNQIDEARKLKEEEELKINAEIPDWYQNMPEASETVMYSRGSAISSDLDNSEQRAIENALIKLSGQMQTRIDSKMNLALREAGIDSDLVLKSEMERTTRMVVKDISISGYKTYRTKMAPVSDNKYRTFIVIEFAIPLAYKEYLTKIETNLKIKGNISKLKETATFKELEQFVSEFSGA